MWVGGWGEGGGTAGVCWGTQCLLLNAQHVFVEMHGICLEVDSMYFGVYSREL